MRRFISLFLISASAVAFAENEPSPTAPRKKKSLAVAYALGFDPIPGDAMLYAGKNKEAVMDIVGGAAGAAIMIFSYRALTDNDEPDPLPPGITEPPCNTSSSVPCYGDIDGGKILTAFLYLLLTVGGGTLYVGSLVLDGIVGIQEVKLHNRKIDAQNASLYRMIPEPQVSLGSDRGQINLTWRF